jgi:iron complex outermembrane receptor protein
MAVGGEGRRERLRNDWDPALLAGDPALGFSPQSISGSRDAFALFAELAVPIVRGLEAQLALRYDEYDDFGNSTNPKVALRWRPLDTLLLRASWGTGFRAPPLYSLYRPQSSGAPLNNIADPVRCPVTGLPSDCRASLAVIEGGNPDLQPESSTSWSAGIVWQPTASIAVGVDYWHISVEDQIQFLGPNVALIYYDMYSDRFIRGPVDPAYPTLPGPMTGMLITEVNIGRTRTSGFDFNVNWNGTPAEWGKLSFALQGTYVARWETQLDGATMTSMLGTDVFARAVPRWRYLLTLGWNRGPWGATLVQNYTHGYWDFAPGPDGQRRSVDSFAPWDLQATYVASQRWRFAAGVRNLFDTDPPSTNQPASFQMGYDPQLANPLGRLFYVRATLAWR